MVGSSRARYEVQRSDGNGQRRPPQWKKLQTAIRGLQRNGFGETLLDRTRRVYDSLAILYPVSSILFHSHAHRCALDHLSVCDGMRVLEVATGSGELFRRLVAANRNGHTVGIDLSPKMVTRTHRRARSAFPQAQILCQAVDARRLPFRDEVFDRVVCCYLLELLSAEDMLETVGEFRRVLRCDGRLILVCIAQRLEMFNLVYSIAGRLAPALWGRQVEGHALELIEACGLQIETDHAIQQSFYPSRVVVARK